MSDITIIFSVIWVSAAIGSAFIKDPSPFAVAFIATSVIGFGYMIAKY